MLKLLKEIADRIPDEHPYIGDGWARELRAYKHVNSGGSFGANSLRQTIGLGASSEVETLEVFWPTTGVSQTFRDVPVDGFIQIVEGEEQYTTLALEKLQLGG